MTQWDFIIFQWLNSWVGISPFLDWAIRFRATYLLYMVMVGLVLLAIAPLMPRFRAYGTRNIRAVSTAIISGILARFIFAEAIRFFYNRPRPFEALENVRQLIPHVSGGSFPSGHASFAFAIAASLSFVYPKTSLLFWAAALSISFGRVAAGVHWPSDIVGGLAVGVFASFCARWIMRKSRYDAEKQV